MNEDRARKEFEDWFKKSGWNDKGVEDFCTIEGFYCDAFVAGCYDAWKASRESLVVEIPCSFLSDYVNKDEVMDAEDVKESLESQGIRWK